VPQALFSTTHAVHAAWLSMWTCENAWQLVLVHVALSPNPRRSAQVCVCVRARARKERERARSRNSSNMPKVPMPLESHVFIYTQICSSMQREERETVRQTDG
jgi:hypothetical protein